MLFKEIGQKGSLSKLVDPDMHGFKFCIEGYPRSANTTVSYLLLPQLTERFKTPDAIIHHTHNLKTVKFCRLMEVPSLILIREPRAAVISNYIYHQGRVGFERLIQKWVAYYKYVSKYRSELLICGFETATKRLNEVIIKLNEVYDLGLLPIQDLPARMEEMKSHYKSRSEARRGDKYFTTYPLPDSNRVSLKDSLDRQLSSSELAVAEKLYDQLIMRAI